MFDQSSTKIPSKAQLKQWKWSLAKKIVDGSNEHRQQLLRQLRAGMRTFPKSIDGSVDGLTDTLEKTNKNEHQQK